MNQLLAIFGGLQAPEIIVLIILGILLFGRKLPDASRFVRKGLEGNLSSEEQSSVFLGLVFFLAMSFLTAFSLAIR